MVLEPAYSWNDSIWIPSLITGLLFGGGLLMRAFGLALVNRSEQQASRLRVRLRMFLSGVPLVMLMFIGTALFVTNRSYIPWRESTNDIFTGLALLAMTLTMFLFPFYRGNQCFATVSRVPISKQGDHAVPFARRASEFTLVTSRSGARERFASMLALRVASRFNVLLPLTHLM